MDKAILFDSCFADAYEIRGGAKGKLGIKKGELENYEAKMDIVKYFELTTPRQISQ